MPQIEIFYMNTELTIFDNLSSKLRKTNSLIVADLLLLSISVLTRQILLRNWVV
jgi:hypothetical protein